MRVPVLVTALVALIVVMTVVIVAGALLDPDTPLIGEAGFSLETLSPNADGVDDVAIFSYTLNRNAEVEIVLENQDGARFTFRNRQATPAGQYDIAFSGVVAGYILPGEQIEGTVVRRLIPDGDYTWTLTAYGIERDEQASVSGSLAVRNADSDLPIMRHFNVSPAVFTPNRDGVTDVVAINVYLEKPATLTAYLIGDDDELIYISPRQDIRQEGEAGWQEFTYEGGVDIGQDPPPDGVYRVFVAAQDAVGQRVIVESTLEIREGGRPLGGIVQQPTGADVVFDVAPYDPRYASSMGQLGELITPPTDPDATRRGQIVVPLGDLLVFSVVVENYGSSPLRTTGPPPGTVYDQRQIAASLGELDQDGAWRVGIQCETSEQSYPWRWAIGTPDRLEAREDPTNDNVYYYLLPGERSVVWGAIRMTNIVQTANPQQCWAGLIHEGVNVFNNRIGVRDVLIADTSAVGD